jgi:DNA-directed RNA polymerase subunit K/omega
MGIKQVINTEKVFKKSENDYATLLGVAKKAREILDDYPRYGELLEKYKATTIALAEFVEGTFSLKETDEEKSK